MLENDTSIAKASKNGAKRWGATCSLHLRYHLPGFPTRWKKCHLKGIQSLGPHTKYRGELTQFESGRESIRRPQVGWRTPSPQPARVLGVTGIGNPLFLAIRQRPTCHAETDRNNPKMENGWCLQAGPDHHRCSRGRSLEFPRVEIAGRRFLRCKMGDNGLNVAGHGFLTEVPKAFKRTLQDGDPLVGFPCLA